LTFNTNIKLVVIDHCQVIQSKPHYSLYEKIMAYYKEMNEKTNSIETEEDNKDDDDQKPRKRRRLDSKELKGSLITRIVSIIDNLLSLDKMKKDKKISINFMEKFYHCQMVWVDEETNNNRILSSISNDLLKSNTIKALEEEITSKNDNDKNFITNSKEQISYDTKESNNNTEEGTDINKNKENSLLEEEKNSLKNTTKVIRKQNPISKKLQDKLNELQDNKLNSIFFSNESIINYYQCLDINWNIYDEQIKLEKQKQKQKNPQESFFHQQFKIPTILFKDMEKANINDRFKILLITFLKLMEFLVKKMSWLNDYKSLENTKRLIKLIKSEYKESGLWCACNLARLYVESLYQTFRYHIIKEDYDLLLNKHYQYTQYLLQHFNFNSLNNNQFLSPKIAYIIQCLENHIKKINQKKVIYIYIVFNKNLYIYIYIIENIIYKYLYFYFFFFIFFFFF